MPADESLERLLAVLRHVGVKAVPYYSTPERISLCVQSDRDMIYIPPAWEGRAVEARPGTATYKLAEGTEHAGD